VLLKEDDGRKTGCAVNRHNAVTTVAKPTGRTRSPTKLRPDSRDLRRIAVRPRLRRESIPASHLLRRPSRATLR
jgi:hypothetical protein